MTDAVDRVIFCFCGEPLQELEATLLVTFPAECRDESQQFYCHGRCFRKLLHQTVPAHPDLGSEG